MKTVALNLFFIAHALSAMGVSIAEIELKGNFAFAYLAQDTETGHHLLTSLERGINRLQVPLPSPESQESLYVCVEDAQQRAWYINLTPAWINHNRPYLIVHACSQLPRVNSQERNYRNYYQYRVELDQEQIKLSINATRKFFAITRYQPRIRRRLICSEETPLR